MLRDEVEDNPPAIPLLQVRHRQRRNFPPAQTAPEQHGDVPSRGIEERGLGASLIIVRMSAIRKLAEASRGNRQRLAGARTGRRHPACEEHEIHRRAHGELAVLEAGPDAGRHTGPVHSTPNAMGLGYSTAPVFNKTVGSGRRVIANRLGAAKQ